LEPAFLDELSKRGHKITRQRRAVLLVMAEGRLLLTPWEVYERARRRCPGLGLTTVYRCMELFSQLGYVRRVHRDGDCRGYARSRQGHRHHLICSKCRRVAEVEGCDIDLLVRTAEEHTGFKVERHWLELFGQCPSCRARAEAPAGG